MNLTALKPRQALNKAFLKIKPNRSDIERFKINLIKLIDRINEVESEEFHKNIISDFLKDTYYKDRHFINTKERSDLVIHNGKDAESPVGVIIETKKPGKKTEMLRTGNINAKALQELILYYLRERITRKNLEIKYLIATDIYEWFIFDAQLFDRLFAHNKILVKQFIDFEEKRLSGNRTDFFYKEIAEPFINTIETEITFTHFDIRGFDKPLRNIDRQDDNKLIALYKLLSPEHLLKLPFANDSNSLDKSFYAELLHIIGLAETKEGGKKLIGRKKEESRNPGSLIESAIIQLESLDKISRLENAHRFGATNNERLFNVALELSITWINRILFLKLLEAQLITYNKGDKSFSFLNTERVRNFDDLNSLFFQVLARKPAERSEEIKKLFAQVPYLNSSLFEPTEVEHNCIFISQLRDTRLPVLGSTVLKGKTGRKRTGELDTLEYLFEFLDSYDFAGEGAEEIQEDNKTLINASVLGLIFEKINGYKDGSFFTPGFITMYMCRETIRRAVVQKFNEVKKWNCADITQLYNFIKIEDRQEANAIVNSLKICDPAVGSGHFLVSALNEIIAVKNDLKILTDREGKWLKEYSVEVISDELIVTDEDGKIFEYNPQNKESRRIQETLFHEKQTIIENCLFGVDINPNSVKICRLRLWIELLKNAYYKAPDFAELETLPNIDINIKCGNSLISRYPLDADIKEALRKSKWTINGYRLAVMAYRNAQNKSEKRAMEKLIDEIKSNFESEVAAGDKRVIRLKNLKDELKTHATQTHMFELTKMEKAAWEAKLKKLTSGITKLEAELEEIKNNQIYENAFEWRFEFPEVLNDSGEFVGFDVVIGNPPWGANIENDFLKYIKSVNTSIVVRMTDSFMFFINLAFAIKSATGYICQIIPDVLLYQVDNEKLREAIFDKTQLEIALNLGDKIFEDVSRPSCIILLSSQKTGISFVGEFSINSKGKIADKLLTQIETNSFRQIPNKVITTKNIIGYGILKKLKGKKLLDFIDGDGIQRGISPDLKEAFIINEDIIRNYNLETEYILPTLTGGRDMKKYLAIDIGKKIIYTKKSDDPNRISNIISYLESFKDKITCKEVKEGKHPFWALHRSRESNIFVKESKILGVITGDRIITSLDYSKIFPTDGLYLLSSNGYFTNEFISGVLNSNLLTFFYRLLSMEENRTLAQIKPTILQELPFDFKNNHLIIGNIEASVTQILTAKKQNPAADTSALEKEIDQLVYQLYGLTEEEIKIVEQN